VVTDVFVWILSDALVELASVEHEEVVVRLQNAALGRDGTRRVDVVPGHHAHRDAGPLALADRIGNLLATNSAVSPPHHHNRFTALFP